MHDDASDDGHDYEYQDEVNKVFTKNVPTLSTDKTDDDDHDYEYQEEVNAMYNKPAKPTLFLDDEADPMNAQSIGNIKRLSQNFPFDK